MPPVSNILGSGNQLDASVNTLIAEFNLLSQERGLIKKLARSMPLKPGEGPTKYVNNYSKLTAYGLADGVDMAQGQALADAQTTYTPSEVGVQVIVSKTTVRRTADRSLMKNVAQMCSNAYEAKEDQDLASLFSGVTNGLGAAGTVMGIGHHLAAIQSLRVGNSNATPEPAPDPISAVYHPGQLTALMGRLMAIGTSATGGTAYGNADGATTVQGRTLGPGQSDVGQAILKGGRKALTSLMNVPVHDDANISVDGSNDAVGCVFSKEGLIHVPEIEPDGEQEYDSSLRATEVNFVGSYGTGRYRPAAYLIKMTFDASIQTS